MNSVFNKWGVGESNNLGDNLMFKGSMMNDLDFSILSQGVTEYD